MTASVEDYFKSSALVVEERDAARAEQAERLSSCRETFARWLGPEYDFGVLLAVLAVAACEQLPGDPAWLLVVGGPGGAKTETVIPLGTVGAHVTSTIASEGALLSASPKRDRTKDATGGLLRKVGAAGVVVIKDFTSILSMSGDSRASVLAALREVYDGRWERNVGTDGGKTLTWDGRIVVIGAVTTSWDTHHAVTAAMGDRFLLVRLDTEHAREDIFRQAMANSGREVQMRAELAEAVGDVLSNIDHGADFDLRDDELDTLGWLADLVTWSRTPVERDYAGNVTNGHAPEAPTRFAKQLVQVLRGGLAIGMTRAEAMAIAVRCAVDSLPPLRRELLLDISEHPHSYVSSVLDRIDKPRNTIDRELVALHVLGILTRSNLATSQGTRWAYAIKRPEHLSTLKMISSFCTTRTQGHKKRSPSDGSLFEGSAETGDFWEGP